MGSMQKKNHLVKRRTMIKSNCNLTPEVSGVNLRRWITPGDFVFPRVEIHLNTKALLDRDRQHIHNDKTLSYFLKNCSDREPFKSTKQCCRKLQTSPMYKIEENVNWILDIKIDQNIVTFWSLKTPLITRDNKSTLGETSIRSTNPRTDKI